MKDFRSGFISIIGRPNVGKSTLVNALLGQKIAAVSPKPQTTRKRQLGILTTDSAQLIFVDTPGMHSPRHKLGKYLNQEAEKSLEGVDVVLWLVDISVKPTDEDKQIASLLKPHSRVGLRWCWPPIKWTWSQLKHWRRVSKRIRRRLRMRTWIQPK